MSVLTAVEKKITTPLTDSAGKVQDAAEKDRKEAEQKATSPATATGATQDGDELTKSLLKAAGKVGLAAIAAIGGFAGVVTLTGSALLWERFDQAGIAAEQALGKVDQGQRVIFGAEALMVAVLIAAAAVILIWAFDSNATVTPLSVAVMVALVGIGVFFACVEHVGAIWIIVSAVFGGVLAFAALVVADKTAGQFVPFAAAVVVATGFFNLLLFFLTTERHVPVTPAAVLQPDGTSFAGYFVAEGSENVTLAIPTGHRNDTVLREIPKGDGTNVGIGHAVDRDDAKPKLDQVLAELRDAPAKKPSD